MPRLLASSWKRVATSGPTIDGRTITSQDLRECAETYNPSLYTAVIWVDHLRCNGAHGTILATRLIEDDKTLEKGQVALEVQMKPNSKLLQLNRDGQKLFSSVEITPDFSGSGRAYMTGLAVTDEPASLGTQELYFSRRQRGVAYHSRPMLLSSRPPSKSLQESLERVKKMVSAHAVKLRKRSARKTPTRIRDIVIQLPPKKIRPGE